MPPDVGPDPFLRALRARGVRVRRIRYRENRSVLLSRSRDGVTLNCHVCFRNAPADVVDAIAVFLGARRGSQDQKRALARIRGWEGVREGLERARRRRPRRASRAASPNGHAGPDGEPPSAEVAELLRLYRQYNRTRFGDRLPDVAIRISHRMTRSLGTISYVGANGHPGAAVDDAGSYATSSPGVIVRSGRGVREIALSADLLRPANRALLEDTLLHEMAHAEAWIVHGHRGHGRAWRAIATRVGCTPRARIHARVRGR